MQRYVGTKQLNARPMTRGEYNKLRGWENPSNENTADPGYLVEYTDGGKPNVEGFAGYVSWSPADVFERTYRAVPQNDTERDMQAKGLTAPRITPADIEANVSSECYFTAADGVAGAHDASRSLPDPVPLSLLTFCVLVLRNGFTVTGESACASPENFDAEIGRKVARQNAINKVWPLMGYELRTELSRPVLTEADAAADLAGTPRPAAA